MVRHTAAPKRTYREGRVLKGTREKSLEVVYDSGDGFPQVRPSLSAIQVTKLHGKRQISEDARHICIDLFKKTRAMPHPASAS